MPGGGGGCGGGGGGGGLRGGGRSSWWRHFSSFTRNRTRSLEREYFFFLQLHLLLFFFFSIVTVSRELLGTSVSVFASHALSETAIVHTHTDTDRESVRFIYYRTPRVAEVVTEKEAACLFKSLTYKRYSARSVTWRGGGAVRLRGLKTPGVVLAYYSRG